MLVHCKIPRLGFDGQDVAAYSKGRDDHGNEHYGPLYALLEVFEGPEVLRAMGQTIDGVAWALVMLGATTEAARLDLEKFQAVLGALEAPDPLPVQLAVAGLRTKFLKGSHKPKRFG